MNKSFSISLPSSTKQERENVKFCAFWRMETTGASFLYFHLQLNAGDTYLAWACFETKRRTEQIQTIAKYRLLIF